MFKLLFLSAIIAVAIAHEHEHSKIVKKYTTFGPSHAVIHQSRHDNIKKPIVIGHGLPHETNTVIEKVIPRVVTKYVPVVKKIVKREAHGHESHDHHHAFSHQQRSEYIVKDFVSELAAPLIKKTILKHPVETHYSHHDSHEEYSW